ADVLAGQTESSADAHTNILNRFAALITQPFPQRIQYFESEDFAVDAGLQEEIRVYENSLLRGILFPAFIGIPLAFIGLMWLIREARENMKTRFIFSWAIFTAMSVGILVPLAWQRYYLPWIVIVILLAGLGLDICWQRMQVYGTDFTRAINSYVR
ncbi:MAG TPA: hypothetical protein VJZ27_11860, partial [Aggregatilineales bacterium]|nr:hypothetical protein [Aggregatilineales bacterium]